MIQSGDLRDPGEEAIPCWVTLGTNVLDTADSLLLPIH